MSQFFIIGFGEHSGVIVELLSEIRVKFSSISREDLTDKFCSKYSNAKYILGFGNNYERYDVYKFLISKRLEVESVVHPSATVASSALIGSGAVVLSNAFIGTKSYIGHCTIINSCSSIDHDCSVGHGSHIGPGSILGGGVSVGNLCMLGVGSLIRDHISIVDNTTIGIGSVVTKSIRRSGIYFGNPARFYGEKI